MVERSDTTGTRPPENVPHPGGVLAPSDSPSCEVRSRPVSSVPPRDAPLARHRGGSVKVSHGGAENAEDPK